MKKTSALLFALLLSLALACNAGSVAPVPATDIPPTEAVQPQAPASETPAQVPPTLPPGVSISASGTSFIIPQGAAGGAVLESIPASYSSADMPYWEIYPAHLQFKISGYVLQGAFHEAKIIVYPANEYAKMHEGAAQVVLDLKSLLANQGAPLPQNLPFLPPFNAAQMFHSNEQFLKFQNGTGVRYLTQYGQAPYPVNNNGLFYTFQGMTDDGAYYVAAILPINIGFLPPSGDPGVPLPPNGVPFDWDNFENMQAHFDLVTQKLNAANPDEFLPSLTELDSMMQSLTAGIQ